MKTESLALNEFYLLVNRSGFYLKTKSKEETYSVLSSLVIGFILGLNLVEISQIFKKDNISL